GGRSSLCGGGMDLCVKSPNWFCRATPNTPRIGRPGSAVSKPANGCCSASEPTSRPPLCRTCRKRNRRESAGATIRTHAVDWSQGPCARERGSLRQDGMIAGGGCWCGCLRIGVRTAAASSTFPPPVADAPGGGAVNPSAPGGGHVIADNVCACCRHYS